MNHMGEARKLLKGSGFWSGKSGNEIIQAIATALASSEQRERERCAKICEDNTMTTPYGTSKKTHDIYAAMPSMHREDNSHHVGLGYASLIRGANHE